MSLSDWLVYAFVAFAPAMVLILIFWLIARWDFRRWEKERKADVERLERSIRRWTNRP